MYNCLHWTVSSQLLSF